MSLIMALKFVDGIIVCSDTLYSGGDGDAECLSSPENAKIWRPEKREDVIVGGCGLVRTVQVMQHCVDVPKDLSVKNIVTEMVPNMMAAFIDNKCLAGNEPNESTESYFLIAQPDSIYIIQPYFEVFKKSEFAAIGACSTEAEIALSILLRGMNCWTLTESEAKQYLAEAYLICKDHCNLIGGKLHYAVLTRK